MGPAAGAPQGRIVPKATTTSRWRALVSLLRPDASRWVGLGALVAIGSGLILTGPLIVRGIVDRAANGTTSGQLTRLAVLFLVVAVATQLINMAVAWMATVTAWHTTNGIRIRLARHVLGLSHGFHRQHTPGELIQRVDGDVTSVSDFMGRVIPRAAGALFTMVGMIGVLIVVDWRLALGATVYVVLAVAVIIRGRHRAVGESSDEMGSYARLYGGIEERLTAAEDLRANGAGAHAMWRFVEDSADALGSSVRREKAFLRMWWAVDGSVGAGSVVSLVASALMVSRGVITVGDAFLLFQYVLLLSRPLEDVVDQLETVQKANGAMVRVIDLLAVEPDISDDGTTSPPSGPLSIEFRDVAFDYGDDQAVLQSINLRFAPGRSIGIVGRTGSGKTSLSRLVLRLVEATSGTVLLGEVAIEQIPLSELRHRVALIPQEVELLNGTIRDNVTLFDEIPSDDDVAAALANAGLAALAEDGIHRKLGAGGAGLSAGEAQLLAFARVWLRNPDIVVLDEATARIDPATEAQLEDAVAKLMHGRTTLIIAHRLSTLRHVDEIVVLDHGRVVEQGERRDLADDIDSRFRHLLELAHDEEVEAS
ncbi:MAG: ABC transporter ATP-binding protein/permease [Actinomycetota bacterium]|nr:ABC transporter ATP-binding protein/permease [Actinomycetota bacterium]